MSIFDAFLSGDDAPDIFSDARFVGAMLRFESALAEAQAQVGLIPPSAAASIVAACGQTQDFDVAAIARESGRAGSVAIPLVRMLRQRVETTAPEALPWVHFGSTSQDVIDSAMALLSRDLIALLRADLHRAAATLLDLAETHAALPMLGRTLLQPASVTSFGWKAAGWAAPLVRSCGRLNQAAGEALQLQLGGAVGNLAQMQAYGPAVARHMAAALALTEPQGPWHTQRDRWVGLGCELGIVAGSLGKIARDISLMGQFELGELAEPSEAGRGGSSAMPHKRNPVACMVALAAAGRAPQLVATLLSAMPQEHERGLGNWQGELAAWPALLPCVQGSVRAMASMLPGLVVNGERMRANIDTLRTRLPRQAADEWFDPGLSQALVGPTLEAVARLRTELAAPPQ